MFCSFFQRVPRDSNETEILKFYISVWKLFAELKLKGFMT